MSWITLKCTSEIVKGDVISYDTTLDLYTHANDTSTPVSVAITDAIEDENNAGVFYVKAQMQGQVQVKASRDIAKQGGFMAVENGAVYVDNTIAQSCGVIWNNFVDAPARVAGDLVTITLR